MSLSPEQSTELRRALDERRGALVREIREDLARVRGDASGVREPAGDPGDASVADLIADLDQADARRDVGELREIDAARERMADGRYGECIECGQDIGYARLRANPSALRCIVCQTRLEKVRGAGAPTL